MLWLCSFFLLPRVGKGAKWAGPSAAPRRDRVEIEKNGSRGGQEAIHPHGGIAWSAAPDNPGFRGVQT